MLRAAMPGMQRTMHQDIKCTLQTANLDPLFSASTDRVACTKREDFVQLIAPLKQPSSKDDQKQEQNALSQTYQRAVADVLRTRGDLNFLMAKNASSIITTPSWSYDFSRRYFPFHVNSAAYMKARYGIIHEGATTGHRMNDLQHDITKGTITVRGTLVGKLVSKTVRVPQNKGIPSIKTEVKCWPVEQVKQGHRQIDGLTLMRFKQFMRYGSMKVNNQEKTIWWIDVPNTRAQQVLNKACLTLDGYSMISRLGKLEEAVFREKVLSKLNHDLLNEDIARTSYARVVQAGMTNMGYIPTSRLDKFEKLPDVKEGDAVCILFGCSVPLILREMQDATYRLIDAIYVEGIMGGEFLEDTAGWEAREFTLS